MPNLGGIGAPPVNPWGVDQFGTPYTSAADRERGENLRQADMRMGSRMGTGPAPVASLTNEDKLFILATVAKTGNGNLPYTLLNGSYDEIAAALQWAAANGGYQYDPTGYAGPLRALV